MFYGSQIFRFIGTCFRWSLMGFKGSFKDAWSGRKNEGKDSFIGNASHEFSNIVIGFFLFAITVIIMQKGCHFW